jgi:DNA-binding NarL/FixJ family response regulator
MSPNSARPKSSPTSSPTTAALTRSPRERSASHVLVVHPEQHRAASMAHSISGLSDDLTVIAAESMEAATQQANAYGPSVVLLDAKMLTAMSDTIAKEFADNGARVVVLAERLTEDLVAAAVAAGCEGVAFRGARVVDGVDNPLTRRQREVLSLIAEGLSTPEIAERLFISRNTARNHVRQVLERLGAHSKLAAVTTAVRQGLVEIR